MKLLPFRLDFRAKRRISNRNANSAESDQTDEKAGSAIEGLVFVIPVCVLLWTLVIVWLISHHRH
jgi:hypothetical protein